MGAASVFASGAAASGPAAPGKEIIEVNCEGIGPLTVSVPRGENNHGAGQIVGQKGHGIATTISFSLEDVTTGEPIFSETNAYGNGHAHQNQSATRCTHESEALAEEIFGEELPPEVSAGDTVKTTLEVLVVLKP
jgi:hypothetical protein